MQTRSNQSHYLVGVLRSGGSFGYFFGGEFVFEKVLAVIFTVACLQLSLVLKANIKHLEKREATVDREKDLPRLVTEFGFINNANKVTP